MGWGIRVTIFTVAFLTGVVVADFVNPVAPTPDESFGSTELSSASGSSLVVSCVDGSPSIQEVKGTEGAVRVKCSKSEMRVTRSRPAIPKKIERRFGPFSPPIAAAIPAGK
jgi:hypothetical protein